jgi:hypothetical protein
VNESGWRGQLSSVLDFIWPISVVLICVINGFELNGGAWEVITPPAAVLAGVLSIRWIVLEIRRRRADDGLG